MIPGRPRLGPRARTDPTLTLAKLKDVVSPHCGIVTQIERRRLGPSMHGLHAYVAHLEKATLLGDATLRKLRSTTDEIWTTGRQGREGARVAFDRTRAYVRAIGEALERYACGIYDPRAFVSAPWSDLKDRALDPRTVQRPSIEEYARRPRLAPFDPERPMRWAWGWSLRDERALLVPAQLCWVTYNTVPGEPRIAPPTSTGWAIHHTPEEAIHTALREVVERDSFFVHWLNKLAPPHLDQASIPLPDVTRWLDDVRAEGAQPHVLVTTTDLGIPSFAVAVVDRRPRRPAFQLTLAAHPDPRRALRQAVEEAAMTRLGGLAWMSDDPPPPPARMEDIETMAHHAEYYLDHENVGPVEWLVQPGTAVPFGSIPDLASPDVWEETRRMVERCALAGLDAIYLDTTPADLREAGWCAAKVLVPGSVRHEYGHGLRSLECPRIYDAPVRMGRRDRPSTPAELNTDAHPYS